MPQRQVLDHRAAEVAAEQHDPVVTEHVVHERIQIEGVAGDVVKAVRTELAVAETSQVRHDHLEAGLGQRGDDLPEDPLGLGPAVDAHERHTAHAFPHEGLGEASGIGVLDSEPGRVDVAGGAHEAAPYAPPMTPEEFRRQGHALIDWIADYVENVERYPVASPVAPGEIRAQLPPSPPAEPEPFDDVLAAVDRAVVPGLTHWQHPSFFAYFPANSSYPAILGELLSAGLGVNGMLWATSPACTELETLMCDWMADLLDLPGRFRSDGPGGGVIQGTASEATLCAILAARERATEGRANQSGAPGRLVAYATAHTHSATEKGLKIAGIGRDNLRLVATDATFAMRPDALADAIAADRAAGLLPFFVCATAGTTSSLAFDPVPAI